MARGIKQGDGLALILFNLVLEAAIRRAKVRRNSTLLHHSYQIPKYVDDLDIAGRSIKGKGNLRSNRGKGEKGMPKNKRKKTKFMIISRSQKAEKSIGKRVNIMQCFFKVVKEFTYLESIILSDNNESIEIKKRLAKANGAYYDLTPLLRAREVSRATKVIIYKTLIRPVLTYGSEC